MKTNKKVLVLLLALAGTQSASLAEKCKQISQSPSITVCVTANTLTDTLDRTTLADLKQTAFNLLSAEKRALAKKPKAILVPHIIPTVIHKDYNEQKEENSIYSEPDVETIEPEKPPSTDLYSDPLEDPLEI